MKKTGLSRGFFYKNPTVRDTLNQAVEQQAGMIDPRREILNMEMCIRDSWKSSYSVHGDILEEKLLRLWEWQNRRFIPKETV